MHAGFAVIPNQEFIEYLISLQKKLNKFYILTPKLGQRKNLPHLSLLQGNFENKIDYEKIIINIRDYILDITESNPSIRIDHIRYSDIGWYFLIIKKEKWLSQLHNFVFTQTKNLLKSPAGNTQKDISHYSIQEKKNYIKYGYRYIGSSYNPHITLGRTHAGRINNLEKKLNTYLENDRINQIQKIDKISFFKTGKNGAYNNSVFTLSV